MAERYDAVIVGSGFGGAFTALPLVEAGLRVLLIERGRPAARDAGDWDPRRILIEPRYRSDSPVGVRQYGARQPTEHYPNELLGGNSVLYGGASLRLRSTDFGGWPCSYDDLEPHYLRAEQLLEVHGSAGADPGEPSRSGPYPRAPIEPTAPAGRIRVAAGRLGLRPFPLPMAINFRDPTRPVCVLCNTCDGYPCRIEAKNDLASTVLRRARNLGLEVRTGVVAARLVRRESRVERLTCVDAVSGAALEFAAERFVVAAGALHSPALLLRSGLAEASPGGRWIGRRLMRHCSAVIAGFFPGRTNPEGVFHKQLCVSDFYEDLRGELGTATGTIQDVYTPAAVVVRQRAPAGLGTFAAWLSSRMQNLLCIAEDDPRPENAVSLTAERDRYGLEHARIDHEYTAADYRRRDYLAGHARRVLKAAGAWATRIHAIDTFSHGVGSVGMAESPEAGALDPECRVWGLSNLWVTDGSCFPTSGGVNPSLTIAANALRVAPAILDASR
ncbi:MAG: GMC family oxidoreductase [Thermoanaerobaculia bacterium]